MSLPLRWRSVPLRELCVPVPNVDPTRTPLKRFEYVDIGSIDNVRGKIIQAKSFLGRDAPSRARRPIQGGDVLFSNVRTYLRNVAPVSEKVTAKLCSTGFTVLRPSGSLNTAYLYHYVRSDDFIAAVTPRQTGTHYPATSDKAVLEQPIPLPPSTEEQEAIAARLDRIAVHLDNSRARLELVQTILRRLQISVLAQAWDTAGTTSQPLRTLLSEPLANGRSVPDASDGFPVLRLTALKRGAIDLAERKIGKWSRQKAANFLVRQGDFFVARGNGSLHLVGRGGLLDREPDEVAFPDTLIRVRIDSTRLLAGFLRLIWDAPQVRKQLELVARTSAGIWKVSQTDIENVVIPVPAIELQAEIVRRSEAILKKAETIEKRCEKAKSFADKLMSAVLAKAFRGELIAENAHP